MRTVALAPELEDALDLLFEGVSWSALTRGSDDLSRRYRADPDAFRPFVPSTSDALSYCAYRLPATYAAVYRALETVRETLSPWAPRTVLDLGAGPGTASFAALAVYPDIRRLTLVERARAMRELGQSLARSSLHPAWADAEWCAQDLETPLGEMRSDLAVAAYVLGELDPARAVSRVKAWWEASDVLVLVEPGTPAGHARLRAAWSELKTAGARLLAPCPHEDACPLPPGDWCHFAVRLPRSRRLRTVKHGELGFEDEKYALLAVAHTPAPLPWARTIRHPRVERGRITLTLCTRAGLSATTVGRRHPRYRTARGLAWGDALSSPLEDPGPGQKPVGQKNETGGEDEEAAKPR